MEYIQQYNFQQQFPQEITRKSNSDFDDPKHTENPNPIFVIEGIKIAQGASASVVSTQNISGVARIIKN